MIEVAPIRALFAGVLRADEALRFFGGMMNYDRESEKERDRKKMSRQ